jgi:hypothetical protein
MPSPTPSKPHIHPHVLPTPTSLTFSYLTPSLEALTPFLFENWLKPVGIGNIPHESMQLFFKLGRGSPLTLCFFFSLLSPLSFNSFSFFVQPKSL